MALLIIFLVYQVVQIITLPIICVYIIMRKIKGKPVFGNFRERIGLVPKTLAGKKSFWIHAVSVGEVLSIQYLVDQIKNQYPGSLCYVTTGTRAGKEMAQKNVRADYISYMPYDFLLCMLFAFRRIRPRAIIIIEAEIWPNFLMLARFKRVPVYLLNARLHERSQQRMRSLKCFFAPLFNIFTHIYTQSCCDALAFERDLGIPTDKISVLGDIKSFNVAIKKTHIERDLELSKLDLSDKSCTVLLVGSVHPGELDVYLTLFKRLKPEFPDLKLMLAPRHFHWKQELASKVAATKYRFFMWDEKTPELSDQRFMLQKLTHSILPMHDIVLVCTLGKLFYMYPLSDIFFLGGTFVPVGGHNLLEPAVWGKPSLIGPFYDKCKIVADQLQQNQALIKVGSKDELYSQVYMLLKHSKKREQMGDSALEWIDRQAQSVQLNVTNFLARL
ncbi:MAG: glycosyltransferase N-terminal domain-containing protein [bacterium]